MTKDAQLFLFVHTAIRSSKRNLYIPFRARPTCHLQDRQPFGSPLSGSKSEKFVSKWSIASLSQFASRLISCTLRALFTSLPRDFSLLCPVLLHQRAKAKASSGCSRFWAWTSFARLGAWMCVDMLNARKLRDQETSEADGSLIFLEANRDPSWVIDGGAKKVACLHTMPVSQQFNALQGFKVFVFWCGSQFLGSAFTLKRSCRQSFPLWWVICTLTSSSLWVHLVQLCTASSFNHSLLPTSHPQLHFMQDQCCRLVVFNS